jgi:FO synthase
MARWRRETYVSDTATGAEHGPTPQMLERLRPRALRRAGDGSTFTRDEAAALLTCRGGDLDRLLAIAGRTRDAAPWYAPDRPRTVTYSRKVFVPLTHLCRDTCGYCTFAHPPHQDVPAFLSPQQVLDVARRGQEAGCKEALFTLGDQPERRYPAARAWLEARGYATTLEYLRAVAIQVIEETGLLPHLNPGVLTWAQLATLKRSPRRWGSCWSRPPAGCWPRARRTGTLRTRTPRSACGRSRTPGGCRSPSPRVC